MLVIHICLCWYYNNLNKKSTNNLIRSSSVDNWIYIQFILNKYLCKLWLQHRLWPKFRIVYFFHYLLNISGNVKEISTIWWINYIKIIIIKRELRAFFHTFFVSFVACQQWAPPGDTGLDKVRSVFYLWPHWALSSHHSKSKSLFIYQLVKGKSRDWPRENMNSTSDKLLPHSIMDLDNTSDSEEPWDMGYQQTLMYGRYSKEQFTLRSSMRKTLWLHLSRP